MGSAELTVGRMTDEVPLMIDPAYGYVLLVPILTYCLSFWQGFMVGKMRTKYKVDYPAMYSDTEPVFNCYQVKIFDVNCFPASNAVCLQRAHQNTLERIPLFLILLLTAGLLNAKVTAAFGFLWLLARVIYAVGYYSGIPKNRVAGSLMSLLSEAPLLVMTFLQVGNMANWWSIVQAF